MSKLGKVPLAPSAIDARKKWDLLSREFEQLLNRGTEADFLAAVTRLKLPVESDGIQRLLEIFRANRRS